MALATTHPHHPAQQTLGANSLGAPPSPTSCPPGVSIETRGISPAAAVPVSPGRSKGGRPVGSKARPREQRVLDAALKRCLTGLVHGVEAIGSDGQVLKGVDGKPIRKPPPASFINASLRLLDRLGVFEAERGRVKRAGGPHGSNGGLGVGETIKRLRASIGAAPALRDHESPEVHRRRIGHRDAKGFRPRPERDIERNVRAHVEDQPPAAATPVLPTAAELEEARRLRHQLQEAEAMRIHLADQLARREAGERVE